MPRSRKSGCDTASSNPACRLGSKLLIGLLVVVLALFPAALHVPPPSGSRCRTPVDQNESFTATPRSPSRKLDGGVVFPEWPSVVEKTGANAPRLSPTCEA